jgi:hypothetical protein
VIVYIVTGWMLLLLIMIIPCLALGVGLLNFRPWTRSRAPVDGEAQDPEFVKANLSDATEVSLAAKSSQSLTLTVRSVR